MARKRLGKAERAAKRARLQKTEGLVSMSPAADYGQSCMTSLHDFRPGSPKWGYNGRTAGRIHRGA